MYLGIEIGGTKLQLGVGHGDGSEPIALERREVVAQHGAAGILEQIESAATALLQKHSVERIGIGFGGPVDAVNGRVVKSHQIDGWENVGLADWCRQTFDLPTIIGNDCDVAALAEARHGAGEGARSVFYVTVGTGIGGGFVLDGQLYGAGRPAVAEIGHLRPGLHDDRPEATVESLASGPGIVAEAKARIVGEISRPVDTLRRDEDPVARWQIRQRIQDAEQADQEYEADLLARCEEQLDNLTAKIVAQAAAEGNQVAREVLQHALQALGWAIAQTVTLLAPEVIVVGGGVSLIGQQQFFTPLCKQVDRYVFPPLLDSYRLAPAALGELTVVHGALTLAADS